MTAVFDKLNLRQQRRILVLDAPAAFETDLLRLKDVQVLRDPRAAAQVSFAIVFATKQARLDERIRQLVPRLDGDVVLWFAYPKGSSRTLRCDFNRDSGWDAIRAAGFDSVRQVAIDADWSALRFRRVAYINRRG